jgi:hypothetical protein
VTCEEADSRRHARRLRSRSYTEQPDPDTFVPGLGPGTHEQPACYWMVLVDGRTKPTAVRFSELGCGRHAETAPQTRFSTSQGPCEGRDPWFAAPELKNGSAPARRLRADPAQPAEKAIAGLKYGR